MTIESVGPSDPFASLRSLYAKVEEHWRRSTSGKSVQCVPGCVSCCHTTISVCRVEADFILEEGGEQAGDVAPDQGPRVRWVLGEPDTEPCAFLAPNGLCRIYPVRPLICRSHGVPVAADGTLDVCPANGHLLGSAPPLNLELLNTLLYAIDAVYCREQGVTSERTSLAELALRIIG